MAKRVSAKLVSAMKRPPAPDLVLLLALASLQELQVVLELWAVIMRDLTTSHLLRGLQDSRNRGSTQRLVAINLLRNLRASAFHRQSLVALEQ